MSTLKKPVQIAPGPVRIHATAKSLSPGLLFDPMTERILLGIKSPEHRLPKDTVTPLAEICEAKVPRTADGKYGVPTQYLFSCLMGGGRHVLSGIVPKQKISTADSSLLPAIISSMAVKDGDPDDDVLAFATCSEIRPTMMAGRNDAGKATVIERPRFTHWTLDLVVEADTTDVHPDRIKEVFEKAGRFVGLGAWRPACKGRFGRFVITDWQVEAIEAAIAA